ncbi:putative glycerol-3-phosphate 1-O-acyltransferase [Rosa chinensis]|uniref:Putative glycerol-3-phosphate 1-O-acyltransferase n=1 Tax=Rosa chinensis TaxID=74649 RepID=A0A2P6QI94_ROSCH|nr:putative glycerol-3-phosphate 1-O-acyltransferase [Rosa chinensis]
MLYFWITVQGHNIILISNHQTKADPAVIALLLETTNPHLAKKMTCIAGDIVVTDPLSKPLALEGACEVLRHAIN